MMACSSWWKVHPSWEPSNILYHFPPNLLADIDAKQNIAGDKELVKNKLSAPPSSDELLPTLPPKTGDEIGMMEDDPLRDDNSFEERKIGKKG
mmetsp:Transcript_2310/g.4973  ORF Transcript_2310/g.4973 Transcript_2310/m.4973 type:complete len:93 (-) Transcript_2310:1291-1569(-)